jgi:peptidoglycan/xylan/chitin deacetylase (PgdA/CDA1 family)
VKRLLSGVAMALSIVPLAVATPRVVDAMRSSPNPALAAASTGDRGPLPFPAGALASETGGAQPATPRPNPRTVPVIVYHDVTTSGPSGDQWSVTRPQLARQLTALRRAGYRTISAADYERFLRGEPVPRMPSRPLLVTFDDGRLDSYRGADAILARAHMRAVIFAIAQHLDDGSPSYLRPAELRAMIASGRWDVGLHAGDGHHLVRRAGGGTGPFYSTRQPGESLAAWQSRETDDLAAGAEQLAKEVPGAFTDLYAVPYSDYGQAPGEDPEIHRVLARQWPHDYLATFIQRDDPHFSTPTPHRFVGRYEVGRTTTVARLFGWLRRRAGG